MKKFMAIYVGTAASREQSGWDKLDPATRSQREQEGIKAWSAWGEANRLAIVDGGAPLGKTKRIGKDGISDTTNALAGYTVVHAESYEAAAKLFLKHPHFTIFPGDSVEIMECLPLPGQ
jgi:hypothetical protein